MFVWVHFHQIGCEGSQQETFSQGSAGTHDGYIKLSKKMGEAKQGEGFHDKLMNLPKTNTEFTPVKKMCLEEDPVLCYVFPPGAFACFSS